MKETKKMYDELKKKYKLPEFEALKNEFGIGKIEEDTPILIEIMKKIDDKLDLFLKILNRMLQPDTTISDLYECKVFTDDDKKEMFELFKKLMVIHNTMLLVEVDPNEKKEAEFISDVFSKWPALKKGIMNVVEKMKGSWSKDINISEDLGYLG